MSSFKYKYPKTGTRNLIPVPYGLKVSVEIIRQDGSAYVWVHAPLYINKLFRFDMSYSSSDFSDYDIINDRDFKRLMLGYFPPESTQSH